MQVYSESEKIWIHLGTNFLTFAIDLIMHLRFRIFHMLNSKCLGSGDVRVNLKTTWSWIVNILNPANHEALCSARHPSQDVFDSPKATLR